LILFPVVCWTWIIVMARDMYASDDTSPGVGGSLLALSGFYQLTPLKRACLQKCQSPFGFPLHHWRTGIGGAFRMGIAHG
jgi:predicted metal-binding membrane protein